MYKVYIKRLSDGVTREYVVNEDWDESNDFFAWTDGNFGCDCNRGWFFANAGGDGPVDEHAESNPCGDGKRFLIKIVLDDGCVSLDEIGNGYWGV